MLLLLGTKETLENCERPPDQPSACGLHSLVNMRVTDESWEGQVMLQRDLQR